MFFILGLFVLDVRVQGNLLSWKVLLEETFCLVDLVMLCYILLLLIVCRVVEEVLEGIGINFGDLCKLIVDLKFEMDSLSLCIRDFERFVECFLLTLLALSCILLEVSFFFFLDFLLKIGGCCC